MESSKPVGNRSRAERCGFAAIQCERIFDCTKLQSRPNSRLLSKIPQSASPSRLHAANQTLISRTIRQPVLIFFFLFGEGSAAIAAKITATCSLFWGAKNTRSGPGPAAPVVKNVGYESQMSGGASKPPTPLRARASDGAWSGRASVKRARGRVGELYPASHSGRKPPTQSSGNCQ